MDDNQLWKLAKARVEFRHSLKTFLAVNAILWIIYLLTNMPRESSNWGYPWPVFPMAIWGVAILIQFYNVYLRRQDDPIRREYNKIKKKYDDNNDKT